MLLLYSGQGTTRRENRDRRDPPQSTQYFQKIGREEQRLRSDLSVLKQAQVFFFPIVTTVLFVARKGKSSVYIIIIQLPFVA